MGGRRGEGPNSNLYLLPEISGQLVIIRRRRLNVKELHGAMNCNCGREDEGRGSFVSWKER